MLKIKSIAFSLFIFIAILLGGMFVAKSYQPADAQVDVNSQRQDELTKWQNEVNAWNRAASLKAQQTDLSSQGIMQLPNTGPSDE